ARRQALRFDPAVRAFVPGFATGRVEQLADEGLRHHPGDGIALLRQADERAPERDTGNEGARTVNRVDHPDMVARHVLRAEFLTEDAVTGTLRADQGADRLLGLAVRLGHRVEAALLLVRYVAVAAEARQRLLSRGGGYAPEELDRNFQRT